MEEEGKRLRYGVSAATDGFVDVVLVHLSGIQLRRFQMLRMNINMREIEMNQDTTERGRERETVPTGGAFQNQNSGDYAI